MKLRFQTIVFGLFLLIGSRAHAETKIATITGTLDSFTSGFWNGSVELGTPFTLSLAFETTTPDSLPNTSGIGVYTFSGAPYFVMVTFGDYTFTQGAEIEVRSGAPTGQYLYVLANASEFTQYGLHIYGHGVQGVLSTSNPAVIPNDSLSVVQQRPLTDYSNASYFYLGGDYNDGNDNANVSGTITSYTVTTVPEPSSVVFMAVGTLAFFGLRSRRSRPKSES